MIVGYCEKLHSNSAAVLCAYVLSTNLMTRGIVHALHTNSFLIKPLKLDYDI